jgi:membrane-associated protease RseP (regulator of RpoE activity)
MTTLVDCPESHGGEWSFRLFDTRVRVKFWFWISILLLAGDERPIPMVTWVAVCFASILLHEFGHVFAFRFFGEDAEVVLYAWGGLAVPRRGVRSNLAQFVVSLAGPAAGFCLAALAMAAAFLSGATVHFGFHLFLPTLSISPSLARAGAASTSFYWYGLLNDLLFVNFYWGLVNLLPVYPLDGGHASRAVFEQRDPCRGRRNSLILSAAVAGAVAVLGLVDRNLYLGLVFLILSVSSLQALESARPRPYRSLR